ncbi:CrcB family protein [Microbacterium foliorum]|uniref:Fluoride-specific ion channel FluC n=1 Tax=Microbacterium foliorum TaxID=104336 RepID=A0A0F0L1K3_9MICO|nr:CrcB family protein [Microbacterium foliorum]AXL11087.1 CrcB family protein [Microbacterium foliorum]KJL26240.1 putative fluoride ion transporter CrcB [Microbacterium foliorum]CAH0133661.1 Putative fluoride ion transporter CrcB [Microbacterium foliorum]CAH0175668.1 Putative fluoride ion transporter CrcB [Microbacterium foliorum]
MNPLVFVAAALAGGVGAALRYLVDLGVAKVAGRRFPWGIFVVNLTGSFALGVVTAALPDQAFLLGAGLLGGYTTFSTAMLDTVALWRDGERGASAFNAVGMLLLGLLAAGLGLALGSLL